MKSEMFLITRICRRKQNNAYVDVKKARLELIGDVGEYAGYLNTQSSCMFHHADKEFQYSFGFSEHSKVEAYTCTPHLILTTYNVESLQCSLFWTALHTVS
jgi:hypothetical protein